MGMCCNNVQGLNGKQLMLHPSMQQFSSKSECTLTKKEKKSAHADKKCQMS